MPRKLRPHVPGQFLHLTDRGNRKSNIFLDDQDRFRFLDIFVKLKAIYDFEIHAYCLMTNHWHMLVKVGEESISNIMRLALSEYATYFNKRYEESGHTFQGRFKSSVVDTDRYFLGAIRYIHLNPVEAGMVAHPDEWQWSGHAELIGKSGYKLMDRDLAYSIFSEESARSEVLYREFLAAKSRPGPRGPNKRRRQYRAKAAYAFV